MVKDKKSISYCIGMLGWSCLELMAFSYYGKWSIIASMLWRTVGAVFLLWILFREVRAVISDCRCKKILIDITFVILLLPYVFTIGNLKYADVNPDAAQQCLAGLKALHRLDLGYTDTAFIGYPCRQYVLTAIPSLLFGNSVLTLHLGFALPYLIAMICFHRAIREELAKHNRPEALAVVPICALAVFPFVPEYYMNFEQAIMPISLCMIGVALFLWTEKTEKPLRFVFLAWTGGMMSVSYTPALASAGLLCAGLLLRIILLVKDRGKAAIQAIVLNGGCFLYIVAALVATFIGGRGDRITKHRNFSDNPLAYLQELVERTFVGEGTAFWGVFGGVTILFLVLALCGLLRIWDALCAVWILAVIFSADWLIGYADYERIWNMQRQMVAVPVLVIVLFNLMLRLLKERPIKKRGAVVAVLVLYMIGLCNFNTAHRSFAYFRYIKPMKYVIDWINETDLNVECRVLFLTKNGLEKNIRDYQYFYPEGMKIDVDSPEEYTGRTDYDYIFSEEPLSEDITEGYLIEARTCENKRYHETVVIYRYRKSTDENE